MMRNEDKLMAGILMACAFAALALLNLRCEGKSDGDPAVPEVVYETPCAVDPGIPGWAAKKFIDACSTNPTPAPIIPEVWCGLEGKAPERVLPDFESVYLVATESCRRYECHLLWEVDGNPVETAVSWVAELDPFSSGEDITPISPPGFLPRGRRDPT
jgi:hypothetical protein